VQVTISIPFVDVALGHSVIYEEYKGNYAEARRIAEGALEAARQGSDPAILADALLARGVVHLLQGEPPAALRCCEELEAGVPGDPDRRLRAASYANLATFWHYNRFPDGGGANGLELQAHWDGAAYLTAQQPRQREAFSQAKDVSARLESWLVQNFLSTLQSPRSFVQTGRFTGTGSQVGQMLQIGLQTPDGFRQTAASYEAAPSLLAYADLAAADLCQRAGDSQKGVGYLRRAWEVYEGSGDAAGLGACQMMYGDWLAAPFSSPQVWNLALQESSTSGSYLAWPLEAAEFGHEGADLAAAEAAYAEAERLFQAGNAPRGVAHVYLRRGYLAMLQDDWPGAAGYISQAQDGFEACGDLLGYWLARTHRALCRVGAGQYPEDLEAAEAAGAWGASEGSLSYALGLGLMVGRAGRHWLIREGDYERALACHRLGESLYRALGATTNQAQSVVDRGSVHQAIGDRATAVTLYEGALDLYATQTAAPAPIAQRAVVHEIMLGYDLYQLYLQDMNVEGMQRCADRLEGQLKSLPGGGGGLGALAQMLPGGTSGVETYALSSMARSIVEQARVLVPLYKAHKARDDGDQTTADRLFAEALAAAGAVPDEQKDFMEASVYAHMRAYDQAKAAFGRYLARGGADSGFAGTLTSLMQAVGGDAGQMEARRQRQRTAEQAFGFLVRVRAYAEAQPYLEQIERLGDKEWWKVDSQPWQPLSDCGEMYEGLGDLEAALAYYDRAIGELEARRMYLSRDELKTALAAGTGAQYLYFQAARAALTLARQAAAGAEADGYAARAFGYAERGKARALLDLMAGSAAIAGAPRAESQARRTWRQLNAQLMIWRGLLAQERNRRQPDEGRITALTGRIEAQENDLRQVEAGLAEADPAFYRSLNPQAQVMALGDVCQALAADTALLQYAFLGDDLLAWALTHEGIAVKHRAAVDAKALGRQIRDFHRACEDPAGDVGLLGEDLAATLLAPLKDAIQEHRHLVVVPYGAAHALPFHALPWQGEVLAASHTLSYLPSASTLQFMRARDGGELPDRLLAVGDPKGMAYRHPLGDQVVVASRLPAAAIEAAVVAGLFPAGKALIGSQATEPAVRELLPGYPLLHFATHGVLSEEAPLLSAILLADGEALNVYELMGLQLDADLVVLSACRTALGEITGGDDVVGLARGLLGAGARAAVVSLWPVNDVSTSLLMGEFYRQLRQEKPPRVALQAAQNHLRSLDPSQIDVAVAQLRDGGYVRDLAAVGGPAAPAGYSHPHFWAPFILVG
jgi:CHAT domain-containing protein/tetratricopeptide (TPR) repeat protein